METWSVFLSEHYEINPKSGDGSWRKHYSFYMGNFGENIDIKSDWRTSEVKDRRKLAIFLGLVINPIFPIIFPLELTNGKKIEKL